MKYFFALILFAGQFFAFGQIKWMTLEQAIEAQKTEPKKILIDFYADWCEPCKIMEQNTYNHSVIADYINQNYYLVKFNTERKEDLTLYGRTFSNPDYVSNKKGRNGTHEFAKYMNIMSVPSAVFLDENAQPITILQGAMTAKEFEPYLTFFATDEYKKVKTREDWENYQKKFKSKIRD